MRSEAAGPAFENQYSDTHVRTRIYDSIQQGYLQDKAERRTNLHHQSTDIRPSISPVSHTTTLAGRPVSHAARSPESADEWIAGACTPSLEPCTFDYAQSSGGLEALKKV